MMEQISILHTRWSIVHSIASLHVDERCEDPIKISIRAYILNVW